MAQHTVRSRQPRTARRPWPKLALAAGFAGFLVAVTAAHTTPATAYELSVYASTPLVFWLGSGLALLTALVVAMTTGSRPLKVTALLLAAVAGTAIAGLPILRGYHFYGAADSLSHLGLAKGFLAGETSPVNLLYPGVHLDAIFLAQTSGTGLEHAFMLVVLTFFVAYFVFVPLLVYAIVRDDDALVIGLFSALLLLPINNVSVFPLTHPTTQTILFLPVVLYLVVNYLLHPAPESRRWHSVTPIGVLLAVALAGVLLMHPQQAINVALVLLTIAVLGTVVPWVWRDHAFSYHRPLWNHALFLVALLLLWTPRSGRFQSSRENILSGLFQGAAVGDTIGQRGGSLVALGGSIEELFVKLFFASAYFIALSGVFLLLSYIGTFDRYLPERNSLVKYLGVALVPVFGMFLVYFAASITTQHFRHLGFLLALVTVIGATAIAYATQRTKVARRPRLHSLVKTLSVVAFAVLLLLTMAALHPSPYLYKDSAQVTEAQLNGHAVAFDIRDPEIAFAGIRDGPNRYVDAVYGTGTGGVESIGNTIPQSATFPGRDAAIPAPVFNELNYSDYYEGDRYIAVTNRDYQREVVLYDGFRYSRAGFRGLDATVGVNRVHSNGEVTLYLFNETRA